MVRTVIIVQALIYGLGILMIITQILIPAFRGKPFFPLFHKRGRELEGQLASVREDREFEVDIKSLLDTHNAVRTKAVDKKVKDRTEYLEPAKIRELKMVVVTIAQF